jgi:hypothetical protein
MRQVFLIDDEVPHKLGRVVVPGDNVLMLVDADGSCAYLIHHCQPSSAANFTEGQKASKSTHSGF